MELMEKVLRTETETKSMLERKEIFDRESMVDRIKSHAIMLAETIHEKCEAHRNKLKARKVFGFSYELAWLNVTIANAFYQYYTKNQDNLLGSRFYFTEAQRVIKQQFSNTQKDIKKSSEIIAPDTVNSDRQNKFKQIDVISKTQEFITTIEKQLTVLATRRKQLKGILWKYLKELEGKDVTTDAAESSYKFSQEILRIQEIIKDKELLKTHKVLISRFLKALSLLIECYLKIGTYKSAIFYLDIFDKILPNLELIDSLALESYKSKLEEYRVKIDIMEQVNKIVNLQMSLFTMPTDDIEFFSIRKPETVQEYKEDCEIWQKSSEIISDKISVLFIRKHDISERKRQSEVRLTSGESIGTSQKGVSNGKTTDVKNNRWKVRISINISNSFRILKFDLKPDSLLVQFLENPQSQKMTKSLSTELFELLFKFNSITEESRQNPEFMLIFSAKPKFQSKYDKEMDLYRNLEIAYRDIGHEPLRQFFNNSIQNLLKRRHSFREALFKKLKIDSKIIQQTLVSDIIEPISKGSVVAVSKPLDTVPKAPELVLLPIVPWCGIRRLNDPCSQSDFIENILPFIEDIPKLKRSLNKVYKIHWQAASSEGIKGLIVKWEAEISELKLKQRFLCSIFLCYDEDNAKWYFYGEVAGRILEGYIDENAKGDLIDFLAILEDKNFVEIKTDSTKKQIVEENIFRLLMNLDKDDETVVYEDEIIKTVSKTQYLEELEDQQKAIPIYDLRKYAENKLLKERISMALRLVESDQNNSIICILRLDAEYYVTFLVKDKACYLLDANAVQAHRDKVAWFAKSIPGIRHELNIVQHSEDQKTTLKDSFVFCYFSAKLLQWSIAVDMTNVTNAIVSDQSYLKFVLDDYRYFTFNTIHNIEVLKRWRVGLTTDSPSKPELPAEIAKILESLFKSFGLKVKELLNRIDKIEDIEQGAQEFLNKLNRNSKYIDLQRFFEKEVETIVLESYRPKEDKESSEMTMTRMLAIIDEYAQKSSLEIRQQLTVRKIIYQLRSQVEIQKTIIISDRGEAERLFKGLQKELREGILLKLTEPHKTREYSCDWLRGIDKSYHQSLTFSKERSENENIQYIRNFLEAMEKILSELDFRNKQIIAQFLKVIKSTILPKNPKNEAEVCLDNLKNLLNKFLIVGQKLEQFNSILMPLFYHCYESDDMDKIRKEMKERIFDVLKHQIDSSADVRKCLETLKTLASRKKEKNIQIGVTVLLQNNVIDMVCNEIYVLLDESIITGKGNPKFSDEPHYIGAFVRSTILNQLDLYMKELANFRYRSLSAIERFTSELHKALSNSTQNIIRTKFTCIERPTLYANKAAVSLNAILKDLSQNDHEMNYAIYLKGLLELVSIVKNDKLITGRVIQDLEKQLLEANGHSHFIYIRIKMDEIVKLLARFSFVEQTLNDFFDEFWRCLHERYDHRSHQEVFSANGMVKKEILAKVKPGRGAKDIKQIAATLNSSKLDTIVDQFKHEFEKDKDEKGLTEIYESLRQFINDACLAYCNSLLEYRHRALKTLSGFIGVIQLDLSAYKAIKDKCLQETLRNRLHELEILLPYVNEMECYQATLKCYIDFIAELKRYDPVLFKKTRDERLFETVDLILKEKKHTLRPVFTDILHDLRCLLENSVNSLNIITLEEGRSPEDQRTVYQVEITMAALSDIITELKVKYPAVFAIKDEIRIIGSIALHLDIDLQNEYPGVSFTMVCPRIELSPDKPGNICTINLCGNRGTDREGKPDARVGTDGNKNGLHGNPGRSGGRGGSSGHLYLEALDLPSLAVTTNGGKGGRGQNGGDASHGIPGENGPDADSEGFRRICESRWENSLSGQSHIAFRREPRSAGTRGGNGGDGGAAGSGGLGGRQGVVVLRSQDKSDQMFKVTSEAGKRGDPGDAGEIGQAGRNGRPGKDCQVKSNSCGGWVEYSIMIFIPFRSFITHLLFKYVINPRKYEMKRGYFPLNQARGNDHFETHHDEGFKKTPYEFFSMEEGPEKVDHELEYDRQTRNGKKRNEQDLQLEAQEVIPIIDRTQAFQNTLAFFSKFCKPKSNHYQHWLANGLNSFLSKMAAQENLPYGNFETRNLEGEYQEILLLKEKFAEIVAMENQRLQDERVDTEQMSMGLSDLASDVMTKYDDFKESMSQARQDLQSDIESIEAEVLSRMREESEQQLTQELIASQNRLNALVEMTPERAKKIKNVSLLKIDKNFQLNDQYWRMFKIDEFDFNSQDSKKEGSLESKKISSLKEAIKLFNKGPSESGLLLVGEIFIGYLFDIEEFKQLTILSNFIDTFLHNLRECRILERKDLFSKLKGLSTRHPTSAKTKNRALFSIIKLFLEGINKEYQRQYWITWVHKTEVCLKLTTIHTKVNYLSLIQKLQSADIDSLPYIIVDLQNNPFILNNFENSLSEELMNDFKKFLECARSFSDLPDKKGLIEVFSVFLKQLADFIEKDDDKYLDNDSFFEIIESILKKFAANIKLFNVDQTEKDILSNALEITKAKLLQSPINRLTKMLYEFGVEVLNQSQKISLNVSKKSQLNATLLKSFYTVQDPELALSIFSRIISELETSKIGNLIKEPAVTAVVGILDWISNHLESYDESTHKILENGSLAIEKKALVKLSQKAAGVTLLPQETRFKDSLQFLLLRLQYLKWYNSIEGKTFDKFSLDYKALQQTQELFDNTLELVTAALHNTFEKNETEFREAVLFGKLLLELEQDLQADMEAKLNEILKQLMPNSKPEETSLEQKQKILKDYSIKKEEQQKKLLLLIKSLCELAEIKLPPVHFYQSLEEVEPIILKLQMFRNTISQKKDILLHFIQIYKHEKLKAVEKIKATETSDSEKKESVEEILNLDVLEKFDTIIANKIQYFIDIKEQLYLKIFTKNANELCKDKAYSQKERRVLIKMLKDVLSLAEVSLNSTASITDDLKLAINLSASSPTKTLTALSARKEVTAFRTPPLDRKLSLPVRSTKQAISEPRTLISQHRRTESKLVQETRLTAPTVKKQGFRELTEKLQVASVAFDTILDMNQTASKKLNVSQYLRLHIALITVQPNTMENLLSLFEIYELCSSQLEKGILDEIIFKIEALVKLKSCDELNILAAKKEILEKLLAEPYQDHCKNILASLKIKSGELKTLKEQVESLFCLAKCLKISQSKTDLELNQIYKQFNLIKNKSFQSTLKIWQLISYFHVNNISFNHDNPVLKFQSTTLLILTQSDCPKTYWEETNLKFMQDLFTNLTEHCATLISSKSLIPSAENLNFFINFSEFYFAKLQELTTINSKQVQERQKQFVGKLKATLIFIFVRNYINIFYSTNKNAKWVGLFSKILEKNLNDSLFRSSEELYIFIQKRGKEQAEIKVLEDKIREIISILVNERLTKFFKHLRMDKREFENCTQLKVTLAGFVPVLESDSKPATVSSGTTPIPIASSMLSVHSKADDSITEDPLEVYRFYHLLGALNRKFDVDQGLLISANITLKNILSLESCFGNMEIPIGIIFSRRQSDWLKVLLIEHIVEKYSLIFPEVAQSENLYEILNKTDVRLLLLFNNKFVTEYQDQILESNDLGKTRPAVLSYQKISAEHFNEIVDFLKQIKVDSDIIDQLVESPLAIWDSLLYQIYFSQSYNKKIWEYRQKHFVKDSELSLLLLNQIRIKEGLKNREYFLKFFIHSLDKILSSDPIPFPKIKPNANSEDNFNLYNELLRAVYNQEISLTDASRIIESDVTDWETKLQECIEGRSKLDSKLSKGKIHPRFLKGDRSAAELVRVMIDGYEKQLNSISIAILEQIALDADKYAGIAWDYIDKHNGVEKAFVTSVLQEILDSKSYQDDAEAYIYTQLDKVIPLIIFAWWVANKQSQQFPKDSQIVALLLVVKSQDQGLLEQVNTGEGKTLIVGLLAAFKALCKYSVDIVSSNRDLAIEGEHKCHEFFELLRCTSAHTCSENEEANHKAYEKTICYGEVGSFQRDILDQECNGRKIFGERYKRKSCLLVDEVDNMCLDKARHVLYLSHEIQSLKWLEGIFINIWTAVLRTAIENPEDINKAIVDISSFIESRINTKDIVVPDHLVEFTKYKLKYWVDSGFQARLMQEKDQFILDYKKEQGPNATERNIIIVDKATGVEQYSTRWSNGLAQFMELKYRRKITTESLKAVFISNKGFFKRYGKNLYGLTGTLGSLASQRFLARIYGVQFAILPTSKTKRYQQLAAEVGGDYSAWLDLTIEEIINVSKNEPVLGIFENIERAESVEKMLILKGVSTDRIKRYMRDGDNIERIFREKPASAGDIILATNKGGRGTDITVAAQHKLHVVLGYLPENERIEEQAFGRTSRNGNKGTGKFIIQVDGSAYEDLMKAHSLSKDQKNRLKEVSEIILLREKQIRDDKEKDRLNELQQKNILRLDVEERLFEKFTVFKNVIIQSFQDEKQFDQKIIDAINDVLKDHWAFWLDMHKDAIEAIKTVIDKQKLLDEFHVYLEHKAGALKQRSLGDLLRNFVRKPEEAIRLGMAFLELDDCGHAKQCFEHLLDKDVSGFAAIGVAYCIINLKEHDAKKRSRRVIKQAIQSLEALKRGYMANLKIAELLVKFSDPSLTQKVAVDENYYHDQVNGKLEVIGLHLHYLKQAAGDYLESFDFLTGSGPHKEDARQEAADLYNLLINKGVLHGNRLREKYAREISGNRDPNNSTFASIIREHIDPSIADAIIRRIAGLHHGRFGDGKYSLQNFLDIVCDRGELWDALALEEHSETVYIVDLPKIEKELEAKYQKDWIKIQHKITNPNKVDIKVFSELSSDELKNHLLKTNLLVQTKRVHVQKLKDRLSVVNFEGDKLGKYSKVLYNKSGVYEPKAASETGRGIKGFLSEVIKAKEEKKSKFPDNESFKFFYQDELPFNSREKEASKIVIFLKEKNILKAGGLSDSYKSKGPKLAGEVEGLIKDVLKGTKFDTKKFHNLVKDKVTFALGDIRSFPNELKASLLHFMKLKDQPDVPVELPFFRGMGLNKFLVIEEDKPWWDWGAFAVFLIGVAQIILGAILCVLGCVNIGNALISEGINDIVYSVMALISENFSWRDWLIQKAISFAISMLTAGISTLGNIGKTASKLGSVSFMSLVGKIVARCLIEVATKILTHILTEVAISEIQKSLIDKVLNGVMDELTKAIFGPLMKEIEECCRRNPELAEMMKIVDKMCENIDKIMQTQGDLIDKLRGVKSQVISVLEGSLKQAVGGLKNSSSPYIKAVGTAIDIVSMVNDVWNSVQSVLDITDAASEFIEIIKKTVADVEAAFREAERSEKSGNSEEVMSKVSKKIDELKSKIVSILSNVITNELRKVLRDIVRGAINGITKSSNSGVLRSMNEQFKGQNPVAMSRAEAAIQHAEAHIEKTTQTIRAKGITDNKALEELRIKQQALKEGVSVVKTVPFMERCQRQLIGIGISEDFMDRLSEVRSGEDMLKLGEASVIGIAKKQGMELAESAGRRILDSDAAKYMARGLKEAIYGGSVADGSSSGTSPKHIAELLNRYDPKKVKRLAGNIKKTGLLRKIGVSDQMLDGFLEQMNEAVSSQTAAMAGSINSDKTFAASMSLDSGDLSPEAVDAKGKDKGGQKAQIFEAVKEQGSRTLASLDVVSASEKPKPKQKTAKPAEEVLSLTSKSNLLQGSGQVGGLYFMHDKRRVLNIMIIRSSVNIKSITGELYVDGNFICHTLELPYLANKKNISSIPEGIYGGIIRYDHNDRWRIELTGTGKRENIQIHIGNFPKDIKGCIAVGERAIPKENRLEGSAKAYLKLREAFYGSLFTDSTPNLIVRIEISSKISLIEDFRRKGPEVEELLFGTMSQKLR